MALADLLYFPYALTLATVWLIAVGWALRSRLALRNVPYPPGPTAQSLIAGNLRDLPTRHARHTYIGWGKKYGDILHYRVYDKHTIVLNNYEDNVELLEKRSSIYSDRPYLPMMDLMGYTSFNSGIMHYGPKWKYHRRIFQQFFKADASLKYRPTQTKKVHDFAYGLLDTPEDFVEHTQILAAATIMSIMFAHDVAP